ncbi:membrane or secreted protein [uncultured Gelidibacter sp.]|uniref:membrane or secreted protein n=1 Tax=uncultured Gelidibacter sp. TaxID=259318 RepID=UPI0026289CC4|nr:membrane or secreted protein [uncultured Gelidibacter sp.]
MKQLILVLSCVVLSFGMHAQSLMGAWENRSTTNSGDAVKTVVIYADGYFASTTYTSTGTFIKTSGGSWHLESDTLIQTIEFDTEAPERVGTEHHFKMSVGDTELELTEGNLKFHRIDAGTPGALQGAWLMSGRVVDGTAQSRDTSGPRKTMKILSGTRFQWIAYNTETKQFMGTGGGTYTSNNGAYTEHIEFFSRDNSRVGNSLQFDYELIDGHWHHKGLSSKGAPINEIWSIRE